MLCRFQQRQIGATPFEDLKRVTYKKPLLQFGERCYWLEVGRLAHKYDLILGGKLEFGWDYTLRQTHT